MYASRSVIEGTNLDANIRQAVNHFEFNDALVSKKGLWKSLREYCAFAGVPVTSIVPQTFYITGGALRSSTSSGSRGLPHGNSLYHENGANDVNENENDDRAEFLAFCAAMVASSGVSSPTRMPPRNTPSPPATPEPTTLSRPTTEQMPTMPVAPSLTVTAVAPEAAIEALTPYGAGGDAACPPKTVARSVPDSTTNPAVTVAGEEVSEAATLASKGSFSVHGAAESCPPHTVVSLALPPPFPLSPRPACAQTSTPTPEPRSETPHMSLPPNDGVKREGDVAPVRQGPESLGINIESRMIMSEAETNVPDPGVVMTIATKFDGRVIDRRSASFTKGERGGSREESKDKAATDITKGGIQPKEALGRNQNDIDLIWASKSGSTSGKIELDGAEKSRRTGSDTEPGAAAGGMPTWVVKPAANSNCGFGIQVCCSLREVLGVVDANDNKAGRSGWVVQRYIERPLLVRGRKFDIRLFVLLVADPSTRSWRRRSKPFQQMAGDHTSNSENLSSLETRNGQQAKARSVEKRGEPGVAPANRSGGSDGGALLPPPTCPLRAWCHRDAYVRTSSVRYSNHPSKLKDRFIHLTNNAVQRRSPSYGQDEPGNKLALADLQEWLDGDESSHKGKASGWVENTLRPRMHAIVATSVSAASKAGINKRGRPYAFELLGYDFMVDDGLRVWLIEVNSNPCLEFVCPLLQGVIVRVVEDTLSIALDSVFRPPEQHRTAAAAGLGGKLEGVQNGFSRVYPVVH